MGSKETGSPSAAGLKTPTARAVESMDNGKPNKDECGDEDQAHGTADASVLTHK